DNDDSSRRLELILVEKRNETLMQAPHPCRLSHAHVPCFHAHHHFSDGTQNSRNGLFLMSAWLVVCWTLVLILGSVPGMSVLWVVKAVEPPLRILELIGAFLEDSVLVRPCVNGSLIEHFDLLR
ncbi:hypothetical protein QWA68_004918, partial [Fusarium oxysporum]